MRNKILFSCIIVSILIIFGIIIGAANLRDISVALYSSYSNVEHKSRQRNLQANLNEFSKIDFSKPIPDILVIGDSHLKRIQLSLTDNEKMIILTNGGETIYNYHTYLGQLPKLKFKKVIMHLGYNDLKYRSVDTIIKIMGEVVNQISFDRLFLISTFPVAEKRSITNERIVRLNKGFTNIARINKAFITYVDIYTELKSENGVYLKKQYSLDGTHLNTEGYKVLFKYLNQIF